MYYTGVDRTAGNPVQRLALAKSTDLANWENANVNNCPNTDYPGCIWDCNLSWSNWNASATGWVDSCRDPTVFIDDDGMGYMVYTVNVYATNKMVIGIANSSNLVDWTDMGPINKTSSANVGIDQAESPFLYKQNGTYYLYWSSDNNPYYHIKETHTNNITNLSVDAWSTPVLVSNGSYANEMLNLTDTEGFYLWAEITDPGTNITFRKFSINDSNSETTLTTHNGSVLAGNTSLGEEWSCEVRVWDGYDWSQWINSSNLTITQASSQDPPSSGGGTTYYLNQESSSGDDSFELKLKIKGDDTKTLEVEDSEFGLKKVTIKTNKYTSGSIGITQKSEDELICELDPTLKIYKVLDIVHDGIPNTNLDNVSLELEVDNDWISSNEIEEIKGIKCIDDTKTNLITTSKEGDYVFSSDGFSTWIIAGLPSIEIETTQEEEKEETDPISNLFRQQEEETKQGFPHLWVILALVVAIIVVVIIQIKKKKTFKTGEPNINYGA